MAEYTSRQGQYLAFIYYTKLHRVPPAQTDFARYFGITPEAVHGMIVRLDKLGLIQRTPGKARSIRLMVPREELPELE